MVARVQPHTRALREPVSVGFDRRIGVRAKTIEPQHPIESPSEALAQSRVSGEGLHGRVGDKRRIWIYAARLPRREQPLNVVVYSLQAFVVPRKNVIERTAAVIAAAGIERHDWIAGRRWGHTDTILTENEDGIFRVR